VEIAKGQDKRLRGVLKDILDAYDQAVIANDGYFGEVENALEKAREEVGE
jgi:hypothetical protein